MWLGRSVPCGEMLSAEANPRRACQTDKDLQAEESRRSSIENVWASDGRIEA